MQVPIRRYDGTFSINNEKLMLVWFISTTLEYPLGLNFKNFTTLIILHIDFSTQFYLLKFSN